MSEVSPLARAGGGPGRRAAFICPRGAEEEVIVLEHGPSFAIRKEGGLGGGLESRDDCTVEEEFGASSGWHSASEDRGCGVSDARSFCGASSISVAIQVS